ncbi:lipoprotein signal peptidase [Spirochaetia bacterium]|nr:lipoprotein signal peptidase [Spirochaetia bacterium]
MTSGNVKKGLPFLLTGCIVLADQLVKQFIVNHWPRETFITDVFDNDILWIIHVRNKAIAFSLGEGLPDFIRPVLFVAGPLVLLGFLLWYYFRSGDLTNVQRWTVAGIMGGGLGNLIDRIFRPDGVVDFVSVKFYGILGFERWPTFNIADASIVVSVIILLLTIIFSPKQSEEVQS